MMKRLRPIKWLVLPIAIGALIYMLVLRPHAVRPVDLARGQVLVEALGMGSVESRRTIEVGFEVTGRVLRLEVDQGDTILEDQVLAVIDDETFQVDVELAREEIALARSSLARLKAEIDRAEAVLDGSVSNLERIRALVASGVASEEELDVSQERHKVSLAEFARAGAADDEGRRQLATAQRRLERSQADLARTVVRSPVDGVVLRRQREVGDIAVPGASVLRIAASDTVWASVWVDETYLPSLRTGMPARIALRSAPLEVLAGRVARIGREVDRETRELLVDVTFDEPPKELFFGQRVDLRIELDRREDVTRLPRSVLTSLDGVEGAMLLEDGRARFHPLALGARGREFVELTEELPPTAQLLPARYASGDPIREGDRVRISEPREPRPCCSPCVTSVTTSHAFS